MAAFVTALIPDLTLLHFRNTTEAGATSGSRDKGLHGKLRAGVCYSVLDVINSRHQRVVVGVRLQQSPGAIVKSILNLSPFRDCDLYPADPAVDRNAERSPGARREPQRAER